MNFQILQQQLVQNQRNSCHEQNFTKVFLGGMGFYIGVLNAVRAITEKKIVETFSEIQFKSCRKRKRALITIVGDRD